MALTDSTGKYINLDGIVSIGTLSDGTKGVIFTRAEHEDEAGKSSPGRRPIEKQHKLSHEAQCALFAIVYDDMKRTDPNLSDAQNLSDINTGAISESVAQLRAHFPEPIIVGEPLDNGANDDEIKAADTLSSNSDIITQSNSDLIDTGNTDAIPEG